MAARKSAGRGYLRRLAPLALARGYPRGRHQPTGERRPDPRRGSRPSSAARRDARGREHHPVLFRVSSSRVSLTQTAVLDASGSLEPLWLAGDQAVLLAGESAGQRLVVLAAAPSLSEQLPLTPSYPLLLGNALYWCAEKSDSSRVPRLAKTGEFLEAGGALEWREFREGKLGAPIVVPVTSPHAVELDRIGLWRTTDGSREGSSLLLSRQETDVPGARPVSDAGLDAGSPQARHPRFRGDLAWWFIALTF